MSILRPSHEAYTIVHPLDDKMEEKRSYENMPPIKLGLAGKISLLILRLYLIVMIPMVFMYIVRLFHGTP
jgi:hypothetical protein